MGEAEDAVVDAAVAVVTAELTLDVVADKGMPPRLHRKPPRALRRLA